MAHQDSEGSIELQTKRRPLCVDVDGTLIRTDLLIESIAVFLRQSPLVAPFCLLFWALLGRAKLKYELAKRVQIEFAFIPQNKGVFDFVVEQRSSGRTVLLVSASSEILVESLNQALRVGDGVLASSEKVNLKGQVKAKELEARFGYRGFDYIGDCAADIPVWKIAHTAHVVQSGTNLIAAICPPTQLGRVFSPHRRSLGAWSRAIRIHQWAKNFLVFVPLLLSHHILEWRAWLLAALAFLAFSFTASGVYIINDLLDLSADRRHPKKRLRPWAHGDLPLSRAFLATILCLVVGLSLGAAVAQSFLVVLLIYLSMTCVYSLALKQIAVIDILLLAALYTIRLFAGGMATSTPVSYWLLGFSMFLCLSLACVKRFSELFGLRQRGEGVSRGRGYTVDDMEQVASFGATAGYIAVLVLALYVNSQEVQRLYSHPEFIFLACPLLLYWISRVWLLARRGRMNEDPLVFAVRDKPTYIVVGLTVLVFLMAV